MESKINKNVRLVLNWYRFKRSAEFACELNTDEAWNNIQNKIKRNSRRRFIIRWSSVAAACIIFAVGIVSYNNYNSHQATLQTEKVLAKRTVKRATLTTSDGGEYILTSSHKDIVSRQDAGHVAQTWHSELVYELSNIAPQANEYHVLSVPRGGDYNIQMSDGSHIHLNSQSNLAYHILFDDNSRDVYLEGEAFFAVAKDEARPFRVHAGKTIVQVLGTRFNVNAYNTDMMAITLEQGSVKVMSGNTDRIITPGEQAIIENGEVSVKKVNLTNYTSWTTGVYEFSDTSLKSIANVLSRWYDVDIDIENEKLAKKTFAGVIFRDEKLEQAIEMLSRISDVAFKFEDDKIIIKESK